MGTRRTEEIIAFAKDIRRNWGNNPMDIAKRFGIMVLNDVNEKKQSARTIKVDNYPTIISISGCNTPRAKYILCAHELGHALLHESGVNQFEGNYRSIVDNTEYEANLFAVALLFDENAFNLPLKSMSNYILKSILDYNLEKN